MNQGSVSNRVDSSLSRLDWILRDALQGTHPVYQTTPIPALHRETAIPPMEIIPDQKCASARLRVSRLDNRHPVHRQLFRRRSFSSNTQLIHNHLPGLEGIEQTDPLVYSRWQPENFNTFRNTCSTRDRAGAEFQYWADSCPPTLHVFFSRTAAA